jgi:predicted homoserine dehydrogenase-like protein
MADLNYLHVSHHGNYWALYRPFHMANLETPISILRAFFYHEKPWQPTMHPPPRHYHGKADLKGR